MRLAFFQFKAKGDWPFVGFKYFKMIFSSPGFEQIMKNTLVISFLKYILLFPFFIIFAIILSEIRSNGFRKYVQVVSYLPHFLSWVVIAGIWINALSLEGGLNQVLSIFGMKSIDFMTDKSKIRWILMICEGWRSLGWDSIIFYTTIIAIDQSLYEAARIDGAGKLRQLWSITLPCLLPTIIVMLILQIGKMFNVGYEKIILMYNPMTYEVADVINSYVYREGLLNLNYSYAAAVGMFNSIVSLILVWSTNKLSNKLTGSGLW